MPLWQRGHTYTFITAHYTYIISWIILASIFLYFLGGLRYTDALLLASGAATQSGQNPVDLNRLSVCQQVILWMVAMITNVIFVNSLVVLVRLSWFRRRLKTVAGEVKAVVRGGAYRDRGYRTMTRSTTPDGRNLVMQETNEQDLYGDEGEPQPINHVAASSAGPRITFHVAASQRQQLHQKVISSLPPFMWHPSIASYSDWDETQKDELGGTEYRALKTLFFILLGYFIAFHVLGAISLLCVILYHPEYGHVVDDIGAPKAWWAIFTASSAFNDVGFALTPNSMASFNKVPLLLSVMTFLIVIGNTGFPCMLRSIIWIVGKITDETSRRREELEFLLRHPRRCFTLLFPGPDTWRLFGVLLVLNAVDLAIFLLLDKQPSYNLHDDKGYTWLINGLFQVASTRTAGFTTTSLADLHPAVQISFVVMMYISAFPTTIAMRKTNVYEEKSLAIYSDAESVLTDNDQGTQTRRSDLWYHIQKQLSFDLWYIVLGTFLVAVAESDRFPLFSVLFEVVSAYGTVGLSLGYAWTESSLCSQFRDVSKLVLLAMQVRGRHRGLPYALDHAVMLPYELHQNEDGVGEEGGDGSGWRRWIRRRRSDLSSLLSVTDMEENEREPLLG